MDPTVDFVAGTVAGMAALAVGYPFDTVKVRLQNPAVGHKYRTTFQCLTTIVREESVRGLYKGIASPMASCALMNGLVFSSYKFFMKAQMRDDTEVPSLVHVGLAGAATGLVGSILSTPVELIKIQQQINIASGTQPSVKSVALRIFRQHGLRGLYRGITPTGLRDCGYGAYFAAYEATCRYLIPPRNPALQSTDHSSIVSEVEGDIATHSWAAMLLAGGVAGVAGWLFTFPFDVVKTRMQASGPLVKGSSNHPYRTSWSTIVNSYRTDGIRVFFRGFAPTLIRAFPVNMVTFGMFELVVHVLT